MFPHLLHLSFSCSSTLLSFLPSLSSSVSLPPSSSLPGPFCSPLITSPLPSPFLFSLPACWSVIKQTPVFQARTLEGLSLRERETTFSTGSEREAMITLSELLTLLHWKTYPRSFSYMTEHFYFQGTLRQVCQVWNFPANWEFGRWVLALFWAKSQYLRLISK